MKHRLICFALCLVMTVVLLPQMAFAATSGTCGENVTWTLENGTLTISGDGAMADYDSNAPWYSFRGSIKTVVIEDGVTSIGGRAFSNCGILISVTIPDSVTSIGNQAFCECSALTAVTIPNSVTSIGEYAFCNCSALTTLTIPDSVTSIGRYAFFYCTSLTSVTIPDSVTSIGNYAFRDCKSLTTVTIGNSVTSIGYEAFYNCSTLTTVTIPNNVTSIGDEAFRNCDALTDVYYDGSFLDWEEISIGYRNDYLLNADFHFSKPNVSGFCGANLTWTLDDTGLLIISGTGDMTDYSYSGAPWNSVYAGVREVIIGNEVTSIGEYAFYNMKTLESVHIGSAVREMDGLIFFYCNALTDITVDANNPYYSSLDGNLYNQKQTKLIRYATGKQGSFVIPDTVTVIGDRALSECYGVTNVTIPESVTRIEFQAFYSCTALTNVTIPHSVTYIGNQAFLSCGALAEVYYDGTVTEWDAMKGGEKVPSAAKVYCLREPEAAMSGTCGEQAEWNLSKDGVLTISGIGAMKDYSALDLAPWYSTWREKITSIVIEDGITSIGNYAFYFCNAAKSVTIPTSVTVVGERAFQSTEPETVNYGGSIAAWNAISIGARNEAIVNAKKQFGEELLGDVCLDGTVDISDAVLLFQYSMLPDVYPIEYTGDVDFNGDGTVDISDAVLLFQHSMLPDLYPIG